MHHTIQRIPFKLISRGSTQPLIAQKDIKSQKLAVPPENIIARFEEHAGQYYQLVDSNNEENEVLAETRDYLLPKLISGEVAVPEAEEALAAAADPAPSSAAELAA